MKTYNYNQCEDILNQVEDCELEVAVQYRKNLTNLRVIPSEVLSEGVDALKKLKEKAIECGATEFSGVATSVFRIAENGEIATYELSTHSEIPIKIVSQEEEAKLGFRGAVLKADLSGGKSMCMGCWCFECSDYLF